MCSFESPLNAVEGTCKGPLPPNSGLERQRQKIKSIWPKNFKNSTLAPREKPCASFEIPLTLFWNFAYICDVSGSGIKCGPNSVWEWRPSIRNDLGAEVRISRVFDDTSRTAVAAAILKRLEFLVQFPAIICFAELCSCTYKHAQTDE